MPLPLIRIRLPKLRHGSIARKRRRTPSCPQKLKFRIAGCRHPLANRVGTRVYRIEAAFRQVTWIVKAG